MNISRELLYNRHRLSHSQIDSWIGKSDQSKNLNDKLKEMGKVAEFISVTDDFVDAGIHFMPFKGPVLSMRLYGDATYRRYNDFDFLFDIQDVEKACKILIKKGYVADEYKIPEGANDKKIFFNNIREISFYNSDKEICIELHWKLFTGRLESTDKVNQIISSNLSEISLAGRSYTVLNHELDLLYIIIHGGLHSFFRLKWLIDVKDFLEKITIDEEKFILLTHQLKATRMVALCNEVLKVYFPDSNLQLPGNYKVHNYLLQFTLKNIENEKEVTTKSFQDIVKYYYFTLSAFSGWRYKASIIHYMFFLPYIVHTKKMNRIPYSYIFIVPFQTVLRWINKPTDKIKGKTMIYD